MGIITILDIVFMKTLLLLRHAKSSWKQPEMNDHDRPLNKRGKKEAPKVGKYLKANDLVPDLNLSDTACYLDILHNLPDTANRVLVVGHNPDLEELLSLLTDVSQHLTTAALAQIDLPITSWQELNEATDGRLQNLWTPRE
jgi:phosphohistidine phosphatase